MKKKKRSQSLHSEIRLMNHVTTESHHVGAFASVSTTLTVGGHDCVGIECLHITLYYTVMYCGATWQHFIRLRLIDSKLIRLVNSLLSACDKVTVQPHIAHPVFQNSSLLSCSICFLSCTHYFVYTQICLRHTILSHKYSSPTSHKQLQLVRY